MPAVANEEHTVLPPEAEDDRAAHAAVAQLLRELPPEQLPALMGPSGERIPLPLDLFHVLRDVAGALADGQAVTVAPLDTLLTTQEAADILGISRPTLVKLLERGEIDFTKPGLHRKVKLADLLAYQQRQRQRRRELLASLTAEAAEAGEYSDPRPRRPKAS